jgi:DNA replication protein DnaC
LVAKRVVRPAGGYHRPAEDAKSAMREAELLRERVGERIYSRLCEMCTFVEMPRETPDQRRTKQELDPRLQGAPPRSSR